MGMASMAMEGLTRKIRLPIGEKLFFETDSRQPIPPLSPLLYLEYGDILEVPLRACGCM